MQWAPFSLEVCSRARDCQDVFNSVLRNDEIMGEKCSLSFWVAMELPFRDFYSSFDVLRPRV